MTTLRGKDVCRTAEEVRNLIVNREKTLYLPGWLEALHGIVTETADVPGRRAVG